MLVMSKRFSVTLPDSIYDQLEKFADAQGRTTANLAAFLIEAGIRDMAQRISKAIPTPTENIDNV